MAEPLPASESVALPDPMTLARDRMVELGGEAVVDLGQRRIRRLVKSYVPRVLHPLIPGEGGSVVANARRAVSRWFWGIVTSAIISLVFFAIFAVAALGFVAVTAYAVISSL
jgi:hypothetical protein